MLDNLTLAQVFRYFEYSQEYLADFAQMIAVEIGLTCGLVKRKTDGASCVSQPSSTGDGDGIRELLLANLGGKH